MNQLQNLCVYCGSSDGRDPKYVDAARELGRHLAMHGIGLVYGGGSLGLMGTVARSVLKHGGRVTGIIPQFLTEREKMLREVQNLIVTEDMHERKRLMFEHSDGFVALPGGIGTLEETVEMLTWSQLGRHHKPVLLVDVDGFWQPLTRLLDHMRSEGFIREDLLVRYLVADRVSDVVPRLREAILSLPPSEESEAETAAKM